MSVYTAIDRNDVATLQTQYDLARILSYSGIPAGITNSIYEIKTAKGHFCLTIFETLTRTEIFPYLEFMEDLAAQSIPCPRVLHTRDQNMLIELHEKPAVLVEFLPGETPKSVNHSQCYALGNMLARFHEAGLKSLAKLVNTRDPGWHEKTAKKIMSFLTPPEQKLLTNAMQILRQDPLKDCPQGIIHFDLFRDNVLMIDDTVTGLLDFYYSCHGAFILDIAVCINDWCRDEHGELSTEHYEALLAGYQDHRSLTLLEQEQLPNALILAALRFWLSRVHDQLFPSAGSLVQIKNPDYFAAILLELLNR